MIVYPVRAATGYESYTERGQARARAIGKNVVAAIVGREAYLSHETTVYTDSATFVFMPDLTSVQFAKGVMHIHGTVRGSYENPIAYVALPYEQIRQLEIDWPIVVLLVDSLTIRANGGDWKAYYESGAFEGLEITERLGEGDRTFRILYSQIHHISGGETSLFWYELLDVLDTIDLLTY
jgi:hypothetical protein